MAGPPSAISATTVGGCTFEELCNGTVLSYACDNTVDIRGSDFGQAKKTILKHIDDCIRCLEIARGRKMEKLYIGKTYIPRKKAPRGFVPIDPKNPWTYKKGGIGSRWREHRNSDYGRDGMIVLAVIPRGAVPSNAKPGLHQEDYTFALEQALLHHFMITNYDDRIANDTFATGGTDVHGSAAYALYMAFRLEDEEDAEGRSNQWNSSDSDSDVILLQENAKRESNLWDSSDSDSDVILLQEDAKGGNKQWNSSDSDSDVILLQEDTDLTQIPSMCQDDFTRSDLRATNICKTVRFQSPPVSSTKEHDAPRLAGRDHRLAGRDHREAGRGLLKRQMGRLKVSGNDTNKTSSHSAGMSGQSSARLGHNGSQTHNANASHLITADANKPTSTQAPHQTSNTRSRPNKPVAKSSSSIHHTSQRRLSTSSIHSSSPGDRASAIPLPLPREPSSGSEVSSHQLHHANNALLYIHLLNSLSKGKKQQQGNLQSNGED